MMTLESPEPLAGQTLAPVRLLGGWVDAKEKLPPYLTPVLLLDVNRYMAFDPYGNWKGVGVLVHQAALNSAQPVFFFKLGPN